MVTGPNSRTFSMPLQIKKLSILKNWSNIFGIFSLLMPLSEIGIAITEIGVFIQPENRSNDHRPGLRLRLFLVPAD